MSFEESLICYASPTLASIKIASLYSFKFDSMEECTGVIDEFNSIMNPKGLYVELLRHTDNIYLIYVYRRSHLQRRLREVNIQSFLEDYGYPLHGSVEEYFGVLKSRLRKHRDFPHEIGVFLGYPIDDVRSFIENKGRNQIMCGDWKVYHHEQLARCLFCKYKHCRDIYAKVYAEGRRFPDMLVKA